MLSNFAHHVKGLIILLLAVAYLFEDKYVFMKRLISMLLIYTEPEGAYHALGNTLT